MHCAHVTFALRTVALWGLLCLSLGTITENYCVRSRGGGLSSRQIRECCDLLENDNPALLSFLEHVEDIHGHLNVDKILPSLYTYRSVALFETYRLPEAAEALVQAVRFNPADARAWHNLGEIRSLQGSVGDKFVAYDMAESLTGKPYLGNRFARVMWHKMEESLKVSENEFLTCLTHLTKMYCEDAHISASVEMVELNGTSKVALQEYFSRSFHEEIANLTDLTNVYNSAVRTKPIDHLVIGFVLATLDSGPVNSLTQTLLRRLDRRRCTLVGFIVSTRTTVAAEWMGSMLRSFDQLVSLDGLSQLEGATVIAKHKVDVLIDMNGFTLITGVHIMKYRPCPIQINFLGDPLTAALKFMDYYIGDVRANPPDTTAGHFTEQLALLSTGYLTNSHQEVSPDVLFRTRMAKAELPMMSPLGASETLKPLFCRTCDLQEPLLFGTFHTYSKIDATIFHVWMNILRRVSPSSIVFTAVISDPVAMQNLVTEATAHGVAPHRATFLGLTAWYLHLHHKSALDIFLDTTRKNGHTTTVDAAWAGLPTVALAGTHNVARRSAESTLHASSKNTHGLVYSLKEYEDVAVALTATRRGRRRLSDWRQFTDRARVSSDMFDGLFFADKFLHSLQSIRELNALVGTEQKNYNVFQVDDD